MSIIQEALRKVSGKPEDKDSVSVRQSNRLREIIEKSPSEETIIVASPRIDLPASIASRQSPLSAAPKIKSSAAARPADHIRIPFIVGVLVCAQIVAIAAFFFMRSGSQERALAGAGSAASPGGTEQKSVAGISPTVATILPPAGAPLPMRHGVVLKGIMYVPDRPRAILNDEIVGVGDTVAGAVVKRITPADVTILIGTTEETISIN